MKKSSLQGARAQIEAEAEGKAQTGTETVVKVFQMPVLLKLKAYTVFRRANRHLLEAEAEAEKGNCSQYTTIDITIDNVVIDDMNIQVKWWNVRRVENATRAEVETVCSFNIIIQM